MTKTFFRTQRNPLPYLLPNVLKKKKKKAQPMCKNPCVLLETDISPEKRKYKTTY